MANTAESLHLSIIVPAYRCPTIAHDLRIIYNTLKKLDINFELICVVDGLQDQHDQTLRAVQQLKLPAAQFSYLHHPVNRGKGYALRQGLQRARGKVIGFIDAGNDIHVSGLKTAYELMQKSCDIAIGSKRHPHSIVHYPMTRRMYSRILQLLTFLFFDLNIPDTQVGLKMFKKKSLKKILPELQTERWALDLELLALMKQHESNLVIKEFPIRIDYNFSSTIRWTILMTFFLEFFSIFLRMKGLKISSRK